MLRIGVIADLQYADADSVGKRNYRASISKLIEAVGELESAGVDAIINLGDSFDHGWDNLTAVAEIFSYIRKPFYNVLGNHDYLVPDEKKSEIAKRLLIADPRGYYSFQMTDPENNEVWRFVILNGNEISTYSARNDEERAAAQRFRESHLLEDGTLPQTWNGAMTQVQLDWFNLQLAEAQRNGESVIVCSHFPLFSQGGSDSLSSTVPFAKFLPVYYGKLGYSQWNADSLLDILDYYPDVVKGYWAGHLHEGAFGVRKNVPHITFRGIVEAEPNAYEVMTLQNGKALRNSCIL